MDFEAWAGIVARLWTGDAQDVEALEVVHDSPGWRRLYDEGASPRAAFDQATVEVRYSGWGDTIPGDLSDQEWSAFRNRLKGELDRAGFGQVEFAEVLREQRSRLRGTSHRTLQNYLAGKTRPTLSWIRAAAAVLRIQPEWLLKAEGQRTHDTPLAPPFGYAVRPEVQGKARVIFRHLNAGYLLEVAWPARDAILRFLWDYFGAVRGTPNDKEMERVVRRFFQPLLSADQHLSYAESVSVGYSLAAGAYLSAGITSPDA